MLNSTENVLSLHDHLINAIGHQQVTCLYLLYLSAAFDTTDHATLLNRLSLWFGIHGTALNWFRSYLSDCLFCIKCSHDLSELHKSCYGVPQGSVLEPLLSSFHILYHSSQFIHFLTVVTQSPVVCWWYPAVCLFPTWQHTSFTGNISRLQAALGSTATWTTSNLLCLNGSNTEFLLLGLKPQLIKIHNPTLLLTNGHLVPPTASACNIGFIFDSHLSFSNHISSVFRARLYHIHDLRHTRPVLDIDMAHTIGSHIFCSLQTWLLQFDELLSSSKTVKLPSNYPKCSSNPDYIVKSLQWLNVQERIESYFHHV